MLHIKLPKIILWGTVVILFVAFTAQQFIVDKSWLVLLDNLHWTVGNVAAAVLAWMGFSGSNGTKRAVRRWFFIGLAAYAIGQVFWDVQVYIGWNPFPAPSDIFYLMLGPCCLVGFVVAMRDLLPRHNHQITALDAIMFGISVLALTLTVYLPRDNSHELLSLSVMTVYPLALLSAACLGILMVLHVRPRFHWSWVLFQIGLGLQGLVWMWWNAQTLSDSTVDGSFLNELFSVASLVLGISAMHWRMMPSRNKRYEYWCNFILRLLPILAVIIATLASMLVLSFDNLLPALRESVLFASLAVLLLAALRQSLKLDEHRLLLEAERAVSKSRLLLQLVMDAVPQSIFWKDRNSVYLGCNKVFARDAGLENVDDVIGKTDFDMPWKREEAEAYRVDDAAVMSSNTAQMRVVERIHTVGGEGVWIETSKIPLTDGELFGVLGVYENISERVANEIKIRRLTELYAALSQCNQAIARCSREDELLPEICRDAVQFGGMKMAWIGMVDEASQTVRPVASSGSGKEYLLDIHISVNPADPSGQGPIGIVIREGRPYWCQDYLNEPLLGLWHERGAACGWASSAALPLYRHGAIVGVLTLYSGELNAFDEAERHLLESMATDISFALTRFSLLEERAKIEDESRIAAVTFETQEAILITSAEANILRVNQAFQEITGYQSDEVVGHNPRIFQSGRHDAEFYRGMWAMLLSTGKWSGEIWGKRKNGEIYPKAMTITAVYDAKQQVTNYVAVFRDISLHKKTEQEIHLLAFYDPLTQLPNRRLLVDRLQRAMPVSMRTGKHCALLFLDLDHFKTINDTQGHAIGDLLLVVVAHRLQGCVREGDSVARLGGDEFVVVLEELSVQANEAATQTELIAEKIRYELGRPYSLNDYECLATPSIGVCLFRGHQESVENLLKHADVAMYQAKMAGRNTVCFFDPQMQIALDVRAELEADLRHALRKQQFYLSYQVQVDSYRRPLGAEALLRWQHPERGLVSPVGFIPLAEETGLIVPIGLWVLQEACAQLNAWQDDPLMRRLTLAVNVSAKQFRQPDFVAQIQRILVESGVQTSLLKIELTESTVLENVQDTIGKMRELKQLGVSFSMDDFGTGYSSLQYLKQLPLDQIKIDQSFVRDIVSDANDAAIVQAIIAISAALSLVVIAEGVETEEQYRFLDEHGCCSFQGYWFGKPMLVAEFESLVYAMSS